MDRLASNDFVSVSIDRLRGILWVVRSAQRSQNVEEIAGGFDEAIATLNRLERKRLRLLIDLRAAPGRNDSDFERAMSTRRSELMRDVPAVAILVQTPVGELQVARITREDGAAARVFSDEVKALQWLASAKI